MSIHRSVLEVALEPLVGSRFQPTGFPDLGAAEFEAFDKAGNDKAGNDGEGNDGEGNDKKGTVRRLLVESTQSMANRLEATTWDEARNDQVEELANLPYVRIMDPDGAFLSASRLEAHRLASAYVMDAVIAGKKGSDVVRDRLGLTVGRPLDPRAVARACFALDPLSLVHGVFFARKEWPWQPKVARAVTSFIEASDVRPAVSGGVKRDGVVNEAKEGLTAKGYGTVPHHRVEYTAKTITAYFVVDHAQFRSYGLSEPATALLEALADFEIGTLLDGGLRLRTACDLTVTKVVKGERPDAAEAAARIAKLAADCADELGPVIEAVWSKSGK